MSTPTPRPNHPRPGVPLPGQHLADRPEPADPAVIRADVDDLLAELGVRTGVVGAGTDTTGAQDADSGTDLSRRAHILEQAHDVLVRALATVDKI
ncbi:hypothetical protein [Nocardia callitridis]|uniref:Uncharacterized protein n=1 Tax=Nocardia callitridis TaxID=648753 RepID=A0ABP9KJ25_9NOCA